ncbi:hypothetical protein [Paraclostridium sordellii]|uniref:hypothetical protein n=1 Tax=Paraclostridium sordellii TaxID=1505 RepID=UPI0005E98CFE|nr:hypothetical protein [Paeniclostridium sordellii]CEQ17879.1 Uncharacterised protein [[Clostridium] sordellii] [Paeniclostridium sordellii]
MTKIDILKHKNLDIRTTAVHEYIHSYLVRGTSYGNFVRGLGHVNLINNKNENLIKILYKNEKFVHESTSTLLELIYTWYKEGYLVAQKNLKCIHKDYKKYISKYKHIFDRDYVIEIYRQYLNFIDDSIENNKDDERLCNDMKKYCEYICEDTEEKSSLNLLIYLIIKTSELALTIDMSTIDKEYLETSKSLERYINLYPEIYHPNSRFKEYMKHVFPKSTEVKSKFNLNEIVKLPKTLGKDLDYRLYEYIIDRYEEDESVDINKIKNKLDEPVYTKRPSISKMEDLEDEAVLYAHPYLLNKESIEKLFGDKFYILNGKLEQSKFELLLNNSKILHIHPRTGGKEKYEYGISINTIINKNIRNKNGIHAVSILHTIESKEELIKLINNYHGDIYFTGCPRSEHILLEINKKSLQKNIYINSAASLTLSIDFINHYFEGSDAEVINTKYGDVLFMKKDNMVFFQCMIPKSFTVINRMIKNERIYLNDLKEINVHESNILSNNEWETIELLLEYYFKSNATYTADKNKWNKQMNNSITIEMVN